ncbi:MAG: 30S ribosomal protein S12 methylthiotransferase RimO [Mogibacterium sp.]|nr:30S ribosomal protein S12 methylthiotransferase RimO [Mogibacterium sp.]
MMKVFIDTYGCAKNEYDSSVLAATLTDRGCSIVNDALEADVLILNTCGFIEDAKKESIDRMFELIELRGEKTKLIVTGCLSERYHKELAEEIPEVDMFFGVNDYDDIPDIILSGSDETTESSDRVGCVLDPLPYRRRAYDLFEEEPYYGYLKIAEGCYNACSFCAIPGIRGTFRSKKIEDCVREAEDMAAEGIKELILIAQDTSQYGRDLYGEIRLPELLHRLCGVKGIEWIRLMYVYDNGITDELIETIANEAKICKYIDMPIQHVSDNVLERMRRRSTGESIKAVIRKLRDRIPDVHIRTTLLVGFPGETQEDIDELIDFIDTYEIDRLGAFAFSDEEGTPSYTMDGKLPDEERVARRNLVMEHQLAVSEALNERKIGKIYEVMIDRCIEVDSEDAKALYEGRTRYDAPEIDCSVLFTSENTEHYPGDIVNVLITNTYEYDLEGEEVA